MMMFQILLINRAARGRDNTIFLQLLSRSWKFLKISLLVFSVNMKSIIVLS